MAGTPEGAGSRRKPGTASVPVRNLNSGKMMVKKTMSPGLGSIPPGLMHPGGTGQDSCDRGDEAACRSRGGAGIWSGNGMDSIVWMPASG